MTRNQIQSSFTVLLMGYFYLKKMPYAKLFQDTRGEETPSIKSDISVEVVEIYPNLHFRLPKKLREQGTCHIILTLGNISMEVKNIPYQMRQNGGIWVGAPMNVYPDSTKEHGKVSVPTITFKDPEIFEKIRKAIKEELLKQL